MLQQSYPKWGFLQQGIPNAVLLAPFASRTMSMLKKLDGESEQESR